MKRTHLMVSVIVTVAALMSIGLTVVAAASTVPSWEILSVDAENDCQNGIVWINNFVNHVGTGSVYGWIGRDVAGNEGGFGMVNFGLIPSGEYLTQINIPGSYPENTIFYIDLTTYAEADKGGQATFRSKIYFNCTTGEQIGPVQNTSYATLQRIEVPVDGPAWVHPLDIVSLNSHLELQQFVVPQVQPQRFNRNQVGG